MIKSLYFNWLRTLDKMLLMPELVFASTAGCSYSGGYYRPCHKAEIRFGVRYYPLDRGLILVSTENAEAGEEAGTIAHEWCHHWQRFNRPHRPSEHPDMSLPYDEAIWKFFQQEHEMDALLFAHRLAPNETTNIWLDMLNKRG